MIILPTFLQISSVSWSWSWYLFKKFWTARANFFPVTPTMSAWLNPKTSFWSIQCVLGEIWDQKKWNEIHIWLSAKCTAKNQQWQFTLLASYLKPKEYFNILDEPWLNNQHASYPSFLCTCTILYFADVLFSLEGLFHNVGLPIHPRPRDARVKKTLFQFI